MGTLMLEVGGRRFDGGSAGKRWIGRDGLDGWWDGAETTFDEQSDPDGDGAYDPVTVNVGPRRVNVTLVTDASSPMWATLNHRSWAAALSKSTDLGFRVYEDGIGWLSLRNAKIRGKPRVTPNRNDMRLTTIMFTAWSADPRKYGEMVGFPIDAISPERGGLATPISPERGMDFAPGGEVTFPGVFHVNNPGTADFYPTFTVRGPVDGFTISTEERAITYAAPIGTGQSLVLSPYAGGRAVLDGVDVSHNLTRADWVPVQGQENRGYVFTPAAPGGGAQLQIDYPDGAYW